MINDNRGVDARLSYDPDEPPLRPPLGADRLVWALAYQIHVDHQPGTDGFCTASGCRPFGSWPCEPYRLASAGFLGALGVWSRPMPPGLQWSGS